MRPTPKWPNWPPRRAIASCIRPWAGSVLEASDRRRVVDLLAGPPQRPARWDLAEPGQRVNSRLTAIVPAEVPSLEQMLDQGRDDIGSESPTLDELPPEPGEPSSGFLSKLGRGLQRKLAQMIKKLAKGGGADKPPPSRAGQGVPRAKSRQARHVLEDGRIGPGRRWPRSTIRSARAAIASCIA